MDGILHYLFSPEVYFAKVSCRFCYAKIIYGIIVLIFLIVKHSVSIYIERVKIDNFVELIRDIQQI